MRCHPGRTARKPVNRRGFLTKKAALEGMRDTLSATAEPGCSYPESAAASTGRTSPDSNDHPTTTAGPTFRWTRRSRGGKCSAA